MAADYLPTASLEMLKLRAACLRRVRAFFDAEGYWEVETPIISRDIVVDAWLEPFITRHELGGAATASVDLYLQTSPEFAMKRLLAAGADAIYQIARVFRQGEAGRRHNPEFTMLEWYRRGDTHFDQMDFVERLVPAIWKFLRERAVDSGIRSARPLPPELPTTFERITYDQAFSRYAGTPVLALSCAELQTLAADRGIDPPPGLDGDDRDGWLNLLLAELVEPALGVERPAFLYDYPASQAALARVRQDDPPVAERFELYLHGIELCNGYHELLDPGELRARIARQAAIRQREGARPLPAESRLLAAMEAGLPPCAGVALGFDRLLMAALGADSIDQVLAFPFDRA